MIASLKQTKDIRKRELQLWLIPVFLLALVLMIKIVQGEIKSFFTVLNIFLPTLVGLVLMLVIRTKILKDSIEDVFAGVSLPEAQELLKAGITKFVPEWKDDGGYLRQRLTNAENRIIIVLTWIPSNVESLSEVLWEPLNKDNVTVDICLCRPESIHCRQRLIDVNQATDNDAREKLIFKLNDRIDTLVAKIKSRKTSTERLKFHFYENLPTFPVFLVDDEIIIGFYLLGNEGSDNPLLALKCSDQRSIGGRFCQHVEDILHNAIPLET